MSIKRPGNPFTSLLIFPLLLCLGFLLWHHCQANEHHGKHLKPTLGVFQLPHFKSIPKRTPYLYHKNKLHKVEEEERKIIHSEEEDPSQEDRLDSSMETTEVEEETGNYVEPPVIPWFDDWEKMVKEQDDKVFDEKKKLPKTPSTPKHPSLHYVQKIQERPRHIQGPCLLRRNKPVQHRTSKKL
ncbi:hypothetical protein ACQ4LE_002140 [Meloidogyne hapla]